MNSEITDRGSVIESAQLQDGTFQAILSLTVAGVALAISPGFLLHFDITPKLAVLFTGLCGVLAFLQRTHVVAGFRSLWADPRGRSFVAVLLALSCSVLISTVDSRNVLLSVSGTGWRRFGAVSLIAMIAWSLLTAAHASAAKGTRQAVMRTLCVSGLISGVYGIAQFLGVDPWQKDVLSGARPAATLGHANYLGSFLVLTNLAAIPVMRDNGRVWKITGSASIAAGTWALLLTGTRGAVIGFLLGAVIVGILMRKQLRWRGIAASVCLLTVAFTAFAFSSQAGKFRGRMGEWVTDSLGGTRLLLWKDVARMSAASPLVGFGPEVFSSQFPRYQSEALASSFPEFYHESPHNIFADAAISQGVPGALLLAAIIVIAARSALESWRKGISDGAVLAGMISGSVLSHQFTCFTIPTAFCFLTVCSLAVAGRVQQAERETRPDAAFRALAICCRVAAAGVFILLIQYLITDARLAQAKTLLDQSRIHEAAQEYADATRLYLPGASTDLWFSRALAIAAQNASDRELARLAWAEAMRVGTRSAETSETPASASYHLAVLAALHENGPAMEAHLRAAIRHAPNWFKPRWLLARYLIQMNRIQEARPEAELAVRLNGFTHKEVLETLKDLNRRTESSGSRVLEKGTRLSSPSH